jgi:hypothetical protein
LRKEKRKKEKEIDMGEESFPGTGPNLLAETGVTAVRYN